MAPFAIVLLQSLLFQVCWSCVTLVSVNDGTVGVRDEGNFHDSPLFGCNRLGCSSTEAGPRLKMKADQLLNVEAELEYSWAGGFLKYEIKYGNRPNFEKTPGFEIEAHDPLHIAADTDFKALVKKFQIEPRYSANATIQVSYVTHGLEVKGHELMPDVKDFTDSRSVFVQCIDLEVTDGLAFPSGEFVDGFGPTEKKVQDDWGKKNIVYFGYNPFWTIFAVLLTLLILVLLCILLLYLKNRDQKPVQQDPIIQKDNISRPNAPTPPPKEEKTPTPEDKDDEDVAVGIHYQGSEEEEETPPALETAGSMGRHFHFRYVDEAQPER